MSELAKNRTNGSLPPIAVTASTSSLPMCVYHAAEAFVHKISSLWKSQEKARIGSAVAGAAAVLRSRLIQGEGRPSWVCRCCDHHLPWPRSSVRIRHAEQRCDECCQRHAEEILTARHYPNEARDATRPQGDRNGPPSSSSIHRPDCSVTFPSRHASRAAWSARALKASATLASNRLARSSTDCSTGGADGEGRSGRD